MKVLKFGGSSVAEPERIEHIGRLLKARLAEGERLVVVFSAFGGVTDQLLEMSRLAASGNESYLDVYEAFEKRHQKSAKALLGESFHKIDDELSKHHQTLKELLKGIYLVREASPRTQDYVLSFGERNSCLVISHYFISIGLDAKFVDAREIIKTDKSFGSANVKFDLTNDTVKAYFKDHKEQLGVVTGFIASDIGGLTTTLGRGGSDYTAAILAGALHSKVLEIWTDVDGVLTCDPRKVKNAYTIESLSYSEAMELSHFGAKVIYPPTIQPALLQKIPIYIRNTFNPEFPGSLIGEKTDENTDSRIKGLSAISKISLLTLQGSGMMGVIGTAARLFGTLARTSVNVIMITQGSSEHSICVAIKTADVKRAKEALNEEFQKEISSSSIEPVSSEDGISIVAIVGEKMKRLPGVAGRLFQSLGRNGINVVAIAQGSSELNISFAIYESDEKKALNLIHDSFFLSKETTLHVYIVGVGLIGGTLIKQILEQQKFLKEKKRLNVLITGIANTKKMLFNSEGIDLENWESSLYASEEISDLKAFVGKMKQMNLPNSMFIDNTANKDLPAVYADILSSNISIATPNKVSTSSSFKKYKQLQQLASERNVRFMYETNVGAGLPVISTLRNLLDSGDQILKIEAVLSGSVSFIFNNFTAGSSFSDIVKEARKKGFTEPDPREDLSGQDIRRKITILAREAGREIETDEVEVDNILPQALLDADSAESFMEALPDFDEHFEKMRMEAEDDNAVLRYIAVYEDGKARIELRRESPSSPFYNLEGSDNMIVFTTKRYKERPLVIIGPGAGAEVTAAGVFSEIIHLGSMFSIYN